MLGLKLYRYSDGSICHVSTLPEPRVHRIQGRTICNRGRPGRRRRNHDRCGHRSRSCRLDRDRVRRGYVITAAGRVDEGATTGGMIATVATALLPDQRRPHPVGVGPRIATRREQSTAKIDMYSAAATRPVRAGQSQALLRRPVRAAGRCRLPALFPPEPEPVRAGRDGRDE
jgi:hypothetical protein